MTVELGLIIALVGCIIGAITFVVGRQSAAKKDGTEWGAFTSELRTDIKYVRNDLSEIKAKIEILGEQQANTRTDVEVTKRDLKTAFNKIDEMKGR